MINQFSFKGPDVAEDIRSKYGFDGELLSMFTENEGAVVHKWHHYIPIYDCYFAKFRDKPVKFLEIGVSKGGSLQMWRRYFGPDAAIFGIDIDPSCARFDGAHGAVRIGSQDDPDFLASVVDEMGGVDVVLDDGSHVMTHIRTSLSTLFPLLNTGGTYMIEDLHTAFWPRFGGAFGGEHNFFFDVMQMIEDMHQPYHGEPAAQPDLAGKISGIHVHDSIAVLEKNPVFDPVHSVVGN